jgi:hypothetical protein
VKRLIKSHNISKNIEIGALGLGLYGSKERKEEN